jgi:hypothetical protein
VHGERIQRFRARRRKPSTVNRSPFTVHMATATKKRPDAPKGAPKSDAALNMELLRSMLLQRRFEERTAEAYALGKIGGFCHLYIGQEAVSTGSLSLLRPDDYVITCSTATSTSSAVTASWAATCRSRRAWGSRSSTAAATR